MRHGTLTRDQAIAATSLTAVLAVEAESCEPTSRLQCDGDPSVEFAASIRTTATTSGPTWAVGDELRMTIYYYQQPDELAAAGEDLSSLDWLPAGYEVTP